MSEKRMKPVRAWALVYKDGDVRGITQPDTFCTRRLARDELRKVADRHGAICRIARVIIREAPAKRRKR